MTFPTAGETLAGRELEKERLGGVPHFVPGQHQAEFDGDDAVVVTYVDQMGYVCAIACERGTHSWKPVFAIRAGQIRIDPPRKVPDNYELSERALQAIREAEYERRTS